MIIIVTIIIKWLIIIIMFDNTYWILHQ